MVGGLGAGLQPCGAGRLGQGLDAALVGEAWPCASFLYCWYSDNYHYHYHHYYHYYYHYYYY